jgi:hypothetical protein
MYGFDLVKNWKFAAGSATMGAQVAAATNIPASGSYVNVSDAIRVHIVAHWGVVHASDIPTLEPKCSDAADGTADVIDADLLHTAAADDDNEFVVWTIEVESLPEDHYFLLVDVAGTVSNGSFADVFFLLEMQDRPVTQTTAVLPTASQYYFGGGKTQAD